MITERLEIKQDLRDIGDELSCTEPSIDDFIALLVKLKTEGATHIDIHSRSSYDGSELVFTPCIKRMETDEEMQSRASRYLAELEAKKNADKALYEKLKQQFEP